VNLFISLNNSEGEEVLLSEKLKDHGKNMAIIIADHIQAYLEEAKNDIDLIMDCLIAKTDAAYLIDILF
jgi:hypothetical protein